LFVAAVIPPVGSVISVLLSFCLHTSPVLLVLLSKYM